MNTPAESPVSPARTAMTVGAITAALMLVANAVGLQLLVWFVFVGGIYFGMKRYRTETGGCISYFRALSAGIQTAFFASLIMAFTSYLAATLEPSLIANTLDAVEQQLLAFDIPSTLAETAMQQWREILSPTVLAAIFIFMYNFFGLLLAMICALFVQKDQPLVTHETSNL